MNGSKTSTAKTVSGIVPQQGSTLHASALTRFIIAA